MNTTNKVLAGLFAAQAVLVALTWSAGSDGPDDAAPIMEPSVLNRIEEMPPPAAP